jgi:hypothetical protein
MAVSESWTDPDSLDRATGEVLTETIYDGIISNLAYVGGQTSTGVVASQRIGLPVDNSTGGSLAAGVLVYISGYDAGNGAPQISKADADSRQAEYILNAAIADGAAGVVYRGYTLGSLDTSGSSVGDPIYLSATAGSWTATALTGAAQISQKVGVVVTSHASTGSIQFLLQGEILKIGSGNIQPKAIAVAALADGTDGELITWSASAVADTVAVGTATHVLTSNGAGAAPTFQAAAGGGTLVQTGSASATAGTTTTSTTLADMDSMSVTLTTTGGDLLCMFMGNMGHNDSNTVNITHGFDLDGTDAQGVTFYAENPTAHMKGASNGYMFTSVSSASHTVNYQWMTSSTDDTAYNTGRTLIVQEIDNS